MEEQFPDLNEGEGDEGTASHWVASEVLSGQSFPKVGQKAPNGVILTEEIVQGAEVFYQAIPQGLRLNVEAPVAVPRVHPDCWGTPDLWYYIPELFELHVWDYKFGWGIVEAFENWQLLCYAEGAVEALAAMYKQPSGIFDQRLKIVLHIVQPRPYHASGPVREWSLEGGLLCGYVNRLSAAATEAMGGNAKCNSGRHCRYCLARHACPAAQKAAMFAIDYTEKAGPDELSPEALAIELRTLKRAAEAIQYRLTGIETQALEMLKAGGFLPGWGIDSGRGRAVWSRDKEEVFALGDLFGVDMKKAAAPITPGQAKKAGVPEEIIAAYSEKTPGSAKLVQNDKTLAALVFGRMVQ